jgi:hypothetical protein
MVEIAEAGARVWVRGDTYALRGALREAGAHWDPDARAWWVARAKRATIERVVAAAPTPTDTPRRQEAPGPEAVVAARARYRGRACYVAGRSVQPDGVAPIATADGRRMLLYSWDGARQWWADAEAVEVVRRYRQPRTIEELAAYAEQARQREGHRDPLACPYCGRRDCSAAYGRPGPCDED